MMQLYHEFLHLSEEFFFNSSKGMSGLQDKSMNLKCFYWVLLPHIFISTLEIDCLVLGNYSSQEVVIESPSHNSALDCHRCTNRVPHGTSDTLQETTAFRCGMHLDHQRKRSCMVLVIREI